jgi:hypothetical protein
LTKPADEYDQWNAGPLAAESDLSKKHFTKAY